MNTTTVTPATRRILMCVSGMSPAVITETLYALVRQSPAFIPDEIHVVTTRTGKDKIQSALLDPAHGHFPKFVRHYLDGKTIRFDADTVHVIGQVRKIKPAPNPWGALLQDAVTEPETEEVELDDISTDGENKAAADTIYRVMRQLKAAPHTTLHASVAGGRKSMSFYMGHAFSLLAEPQDTLSHVLVNEPFENTRVPFFYPTPNPTTLHWTDHAGKEHSISTGVADVKLAELSVLKLGALMGKEWPVKAQESFEVAVRLAQAALVVPEVRIHLEPAQAYLEICDQRIDLSPQQFAVFALYALARKYEDELPNGAALAPEEFSAQFWEALSEHMTRGRFSKETTNFSPVRSKIHEAVVSAVGPAAHHFKIEADRKKNNGTTRPIFLDIPPDRITLLGAELKEWWRLLKAELRKQPSTSKPS